MCTTTPILVFLPLCWGHSVHQHPRLGQAALEAMRGSLYLSLTWIYRKYIFPSLSRDYIKKSVREIVTINIRYHFYYCVPWLAFQQSVRHISCVLSKQNSVHHCMEETRDYTPHLYFLKLDHEVALSSCVLRSKRSESCLRTQGQGSGNRTSRKTDTYRTFDITVILLFLWPLESTPLFPQ